MVFLFKILMYEYPTLWEWLSTDATDFAEIWHEVMNIQIRTSRPHFFYYAQAPPRRLDPFVANTTYNKDNGAQPC